MDQQPQAPQKLIDFNEELKSLCDKYQYELRPILQFDPVRGIFAILQAFDVSPKDEGVALTPQPETPATETPATPAESLPNEAPANPEATNQSENPPTLETSQDADANSPVDNTLVN